MFYNIKPKLRKASINAGIKRLIIRCFIKEEMDPYNIFAKWCGINPEIKILGEEGIIKIIRKELSRCYKQIAEYERRLP